MKYLIQKLLLLFAFCILHSAFCNAQNLVPNPSFENHTSCPTSQCQIHRATGWQSFGYTPDYFNACGYPSWSVPQNAFGYQHAATGNAYAGIFSYYFINNIREYIGTQLINPLIINHKYYVSFKTNMPENIITCAANKLGVLFSTVSYALDTLCNTTTSLLPQNYAHIYENAIITDTANWTLVSGTFTADSSYNYIIIGNFFDDVHTDTIKLNNSPINSYYFIDDVSVELDTTTSIDEILEQSINIFPNPVNSVMHISAENMRDYKLKFYNITGELILQLDKLNNSTDIDLSSYSNGIYSLQVISTNKIFNKKFIINKN